MRHTKIIATIGPATRPPAMLRKLIEAGCNVIRVNMSHSSQQQAASLITDVRTISDRVAILLDTRGPEIRTTEVEAPFELDEGRTVIVLGEPGITTPDVIRVTYNGLARALEQGTVILINDGQIQLEVLGSDGPALVCNVTKGGQLKSKKGVNVPGVRLPMPFMDARDESDIRFGVRHQVDFIAASFVNQAEDVHQIKEIVAEEGGKTAVISKIESRYAVKNLADIIAVSEGLMVARGDLGVEIPLEEVPVVQKRIIDECRAAGKTVIVATEMLESMIHNPRPTRAETSDVANAIFEGTDAVMLSGETSVGDHPIETVRTMGRIAEIAEKEAARRYVELPGEAHASEVSELICKAAFIAARELRLKGILVPTSSGSTALRMSKYRPPAPILATTPDMGVARRLALSYGIIALPSRHFGRMENMIRRSCQLMVEHGHLDRQDLIAVVAGVPVGHSGNTNLLTLQKVDALVERAERR